MALPVADVDSSQIEKQMVRGSMWMLAMRWGMRLIGIISTAILARLLVPEDFGIIAMAMIVVGLVEVFSQLGVDLALIQRCLAPKFCAIPD